MALAWTSCSSGADEPGSAEPAKLDDPCLLLSRVEIEAAVGSPVGEPYEPSQRGFPPFDVVGMRFCAFDAPTVVGAVSLGVTSALAPSVFEEYKEQQGQDPSEFSALTPIRGLGDEAVMARGSNLVALQGDYVVGVAVLFGQGVPYREERLIRLMTKALERLEP